MDPQHSKQVAGRSGPARASAEERILHASAALFAKYGYSGASTRDIARRAKINEASVYRYFASKRDLFTAVLDRQLRTLRSKAESLRRIPTTKTQREAIGDVFHFLMDTAVDQPELMRLLQFGALEFGAALKPLYRKHLGAVVGATTKHLQRSSEQAPLSRFHAQMTVLSFIATVVLAQHFYRLLVRAPVATNPKTIAETCADIWHSVLSDGGRGERATIKPRGASS